MARTVYFDANNKETRVTPTNRLPVVLDSTSLTDAVPVRDVKTAITLLASAARTATGTGADVTDVEMEKATSLLVVINVTAQSGTTPTLDVAIQVKLDGSYTNLARFSQYGAATGKKAGNVKRDLSFATEIVLEADPAVGSGFAVNQHDWSDTFRVKWTIGGTTPSFTFSVACYPIR